MGRGLMDQPETSTLVPSRRSTLDSLKDKKRETELRLQKIDEAIQLFEENPNIARAIDLLGNI